MPARRCPLTHTDRYTLFSHEEENNFSLRLLIFSRSSSVLLRLNDISLSHKSVNVCDSGGGLRRDVQ
ncbi:hypothetical protein ABG768_022042, partial [Culter alburnus]